MMEDLSLHILDIAENSIMADATRILITVNENEPKDLLTIRVTDNGRGMSGPERKKALDPFFTTKGKRTGLGLPFLAQAAGQSGGSLTIDSTPGKGTKVVARFRHGHIDRPPFTKMAETMTVLILSHPEIDFRYLHRRNGKTFSFSGHRHLADAGASSWMDPEIIGSLKTTMQAGLRRIGRT
jgi:hypothetical protein